MRQHLKPCQLLCFQPLKEIVENGYCHHVVTNICKSSSQMRHSGMESVTKRQIDYSERPATALESSRTKPQATSKTIPVESKESLSPPPRANSYALEKAGRLCC